MPSEKSYSLVLITPADGGNPLSSYLPGTYLYFSRDFTRVWAEKQEESTAVYRVRHPDRAQYAFGRLAEYVSLPGDGANRPTSDLHYMQDTYADYFQLDTGDGLTVYVWRPTPDTFRFGVAEGMNGEEPPKGLRAFSLAQVKTVLDTYSLPRSRVTVRPCHHPEEETDDYPMDDYYQRVLEWALGYRQAPESPAPEQPAYQTVAVTPSPEGEAALEALPAFTAQKGMDYHYVYPVIPVSDRETLEQVLAVAEHFQPVEEQLAYRKITEQYGDRYFRENSLLVVYMPRQERPAIPTALCRQTKNLTVSFSFDGYGTGKNTYLTVIEMTEDDLSDYMNIVALSPWGGDPLSSFSLVI